VCDETIININFHQTIENMAIYTDDHENDNSNLSIILIYAGYTNANKPESENYFRTDNHSNGVKAADLIWFCPMKLL
jgi:hypothetical protein